MPAFPWDEEGWEDLSPEEKREKIKEWIKRNRATAASIGLGLAGASIVVVPALVTAPVVGILGLFGFGSGGIVGGSVAAGLQAMIGNVAAGSWFATLTSTAMGGYGLAGLTTAVQSVGTYATVTRLANGLWSRNEGKEDDGEDSAYTAGAGPPSPKAPEDDGDGSGAEKTPRASQEKPRDKDFDEETTLSDGSGTSGEESFIQVPDPSPVGRRIIIDL
ncbi:hypothetical protein QBC32DRAFT_376384 [Pseudoneurospora amorphoporcata]|uniref:Uncharacterized protein n=1 Tax=Pseudoneurospora amorphoporcata TaxID=241081 RepID=A0AAN6SJL9_9PEZI|nr:hypothetical protein QBC32DRAFT_376384 [Pseudoneurospora amorphoporcata]